MMRTAPAPVLALLLAIGSVGAYPSRPAGCGDPAPIPPLGAAHERRAGGSATLLQVHTFVRHGDRSPAFPYQCWADDDVSYNCSVDQLEATTIDDGGSTASPARLYRRAHMDTEVLKGDCGLSQLTRTGFEQELKNGGFLRDAYVTRAGLLPPEYDASQVMGRSDNTQRTVKSGQAVLSGLYPPAAGSEDGSDSDMIPVIDWYVMDDAVDKMLVPPTGGSAVCPAVTAQQKAAEASAAYQQHLQQVTLPLDKKVAAAFGLPAVPTNWTFGGIDTKLDCIMTHVCHDRPVPAGLDDTLMGEILDEVVWQWRYIAGYGDWSRFAMGPLVGEISAHMHSVMQERAAGHGLGKGVAGTGERNDTESQAAPTTPKMYIYAGHDDAPIMPLVYALGAWTDSTGWSPYASMINLELYATPGAGSGHAVRMVYNGAVQTMAGCSSTLCDWAEFSVLVSKLVPSSAECNPSPSSTTTGPSEARSAASVGLSWALPGALRRLEGALPN